VGQKGFCRRLAGRGTGRSVKVELEEPFLALEAHNGPDGPRQPDFGSDFSGMG